MRLAVNKWLLKIELDGEWEECAFSSRKEAIASFVSLARDYPLKFHQAVLIHADSECRISKDNNRSAKEWVN